MTRFFWHWTFAVATAGFSYAATAGCDATVEGNDAMQYNVKEITVDASCKEIKITLKHSGKLPKAAMGHNWVLSEAKDMQAIIGDATKAGPTKDYQSSLPAVIAHTKLVGGGESDTITFPGSKVKKGGDYKFFCTFPGHSAMMNGKFVVK